MHDVALMNAIDPMTNLLPYKFEPVPKFGTWYHPAVIQPYNAPHRCLGDWAFNPAVGCRRGCRFCNVAESSMKFLKSQLSIHDVTDPVTQWGEYMFLREWCESEFLKSLHRAENTPRENLSAGGNRAILLSSATDAYQEIPPADATNARELNQQLRCRRRRALELILGKSTLNVRIHTRGSSACEDFDLYRQFGPRLMFGMSLPTLRDDLSKLYEPDAPLPSERMATLQAAKDFGLNVFVAMSPIFPECDAFDLHDTLKAIRALAPRTIFCEPLRLRARELERIETHASDMGAKLKTSVFKTDEAWTNYAIASLTDVQLLARELGVENRLHLWLDKTLGEKSVIRQQPRPRQYERWIHHWQNRVSEWPTA